jgi:5-oxoprolinase (ATP-hydrolysing) subunit A
MASIDLNSDLGESFGIWKLGDDEAMLEVVTSANVACGFHAGDPSTLRRVCNAAVHNGVAIGAQVAYPDLLGFGRRFIDMDPAELRDAVLYQLGALDAFAQVAGAEVAYVKPHGALYHATIDGAAQAEAVVAAAAEYDPSLAVLGAPGSHLLRAADDAGLEPVVEAFADRAYLRDGRLVPRTEPDALVLDAAEVAARAVRLATEHEVLSVDGTVVKVAVRSLCLHGDTPGAVGLARAVRDALDAAGIGVLPFTA